MNERIEELILDANSQTGNKFDLNHADLNNFLTKLTELLVLKCAKIVDTWSDEVPCSEGYDIFTVGKLKEHFGVDNE